MNMNKKHLFAMGLSALTVLFVLAGCEAPMNSTVATRSDAPAERAVTAESGARQEREGAEPTFFSQLSDNPSIPDHLKTYSRAKGRLDLVGGEVEPLGFELSVRNLTTDSVVAIEIRGEGSADGPTLVKLYGPENSNAIVTDGSLEEGVTGTINDEDVTDGDVSALIWEELVEGNGVVVVTTDSGVEIAGVVRLRPVGGWIAV